MSLGSIHGDPPGSAKSACARRREWQRCAHAETSMTAIGTSSRGASRVCRARRIESPCRVASCRPGQSRAAAGAVMGCRNVTSAHGTELAFPVPRAHVAGADGTQQCRERAWRMELTDDLSDTCGLEGTAMTMLQQIELTCPVCETRFRSQAVVATNSFGGKRTDFHERAAGTQP